jgi:hypothetical protein
MTDPSTTSLELEMELTGHETDEELESAIRAKLADIFGVLGRSAAEFAWDQGQGAGESTDGKAEFVSVMQQDYIASTSPQDQETMLQGILEQARQHRDSLRDRVADLAVLA